MSRSASSTTSAVISLRPFSLFRAALKPFETVSSILWWDLREPRL
jgi:hypothetical protein